MRSALLLLLLALAAYWPQLSAAEWRGTEARRVQIALEMLQSGRYAVPTLGGEPTFAKPPLHYWVLAAALRWSAAPAWLRLPSVLALWLLAAAAFFPLRRHYSGLSAWIGAAGILLSPAILQHGATAEIDPLFTALTGISIVWLAEGAAFGSKRRLLLAGAAGGLAILTKGPPYLLFLAGTGLVWLRRLRLSGARFFFPPLVALPLAYYAPLLLWHDTAQLGSTVGEETVGRIATFTLEHLLDTPVHFARAVLLLLPLGVWTFHEYRADREMREAVLGREEACLRMCAGAMVGAVLLLALFPARPARYLMPGIPCFLVALAPAVAAYARWGVQPSRLLGKAVLALGVLGAAGLCVTPWLPFPYDGRTSLGCAAVALAGYAVRVRRHVVAWALLVPLALAWTVLPDWQRRLEAAPRSERTAAAILERELERLGASDLASLGHVPAGIVLALGRIPPGDELQRREPSARFLLVEDPDRPVAVDASVVPGYVDRVRLRLDDKCLVVKERR